MMQIVAPPHRHLHLLAPLLLLQGLARPLPLLRVQELVQELVQGVTMVGQAPALQRGIVVNL